MRKRLRSICAWRIDGFRHHQRDAGRDQLRWQRAANDLDGAADDIVSGKSKLEWIGLDRGGENEHADPFFTCLRVIFRLHRG